ncbi:hypothetical protein [Haloferula sp. A504]|uniref:hypothetical protein n=1 Tax=Haloferula sp. A504 TaxID=3373601 RepID=UPI0031BCB53B|nr:heparinase II/III-family protein [Verrucomicrobiaceae bacterium E54]
MNFPGITSAARLGLVLALLQSEALAGELIALTSDRDIRENGTLWDVTRTVLQPGGSGDPALDRCSVLVFQLPDLGGVAEPFQNASLRVQLADTTASSSTTLPDVDLYGLGRRSSPEVLVSDYYGETAVPDPTNATRLQASFLTKDSPNGLIETNPIGIGALRSYLNEQYASGAGIGDYVFLRLSTTSPSSAVRRYTLLSSDGGSNEPNVTKPRIVYNDSSISLLRPFIWVDDDDKAGINQKIAEQPWAASVYSGMVSRVAADLGRHQSDRDAYLREMPILWNESPPAFKTIPAYSESSVRFAIVNKFNDALDSAVLFYLSGDEKYARCAADILHNSIQALLAVSPSTNTTNGGWIFQNDLLKEARAIGCQLPIVYDFLFNWLLVNQVHDVASAQMVDFDFDDAQEVFRTYDQLCRDHGNGDNNWSALMSVCQMNNLLALDSKTERDAALQVLIHDGTSRQASIVDDYNTAYSDPGDVWPESLQYANAVSTLRSFEMAVCERFDPSTNLFANYPNLPTSVSRLLYFRYPNKVDQISFGDGPRDVESEPYFYYELIYAHAHEIGDTQLIEKYGPLIKAGIDAGRHNRSALADFIPLGAQNTHLQLLWFAPTVSGVAGEPELPRTDELPFAGILLQRNVPETSALNYGLMGFVGGASFTHSHASGMSMELYGAGHVMGAKSGRSDYGTTLHENYYRLFASNNTVIVNGASRGDGGWQDIGINKVQRVAMEPEPFEEAVSDVFSFTCSSFQDDKGTQAEAGQQRTLAIVRSSPTTGFYVDVFRSDSSLDNEYHDYIYRNIGDLNPAIQADGSILSLTSSPNRFQSDIGDSYQQPGWRYFSDTSVSTATSDPLFVRFKATIGGRVSRMDMRMPTIASREIARVASPPIVDAPSPYHSRNAPAVVVRQTGEAWKNPFVSVFEPSFESDGSTVQSVEAFSQGGVVRCVKVESVVDGESVTHYVVSNPQATQTFSNSGIGISFTGRFGIVEDREDGTVRMYLGAGSAIQYQGNSLTSNGGGNTQAEAVLVPYFDPSVRSNSAITVTEAPKQGYALWASTHAPNSLPTDDFDQDGVMNAVEYVLGGSHLANDLEKLPTVTREGDRVDFRFRRSQASIDGQTTLQVEVGNSPDDLAEIHPVPDGAVSASPGLSVVKDVVSGYDEITFSMEVDAAEKKFIRLRTTP